MTAIERDVLVITGTGGMGVAVARRLGTGRHIILADIDEARITPVVDELTALGYTATAHVTDVSDVDSVRSLAAASASLGPVMSLVHTAGLSPVQAPVEAVLRVDLLGTALVIDAFGDVIARGGAGVVIASMAGTLGSLDREVEGRLALTPAADLLALDDLSAAAVPDSATAYVVAKRANQVRVRAAANAWGRRGARINSISPGVIATPMGNAELSGPSGEVMSAMIAGSATQRIGTPEDIAAVTEFLLSPAASYVTGTDVLVDGGVVASFFAG